MIIIILTQNPDDCQLLAYFASLTYFAFALYMFCLFCMFCIFCMFCMFCMLMMLIKSLRILIIAGLWHIATALANLLTGYILQVKGIFKRKPCFCTTAILISSIWAWSESWRRLRSASCSPSSTRSSSCEGSSWRRRSLSGTCSTCAPSKMALVWSSGRGKGGKGWSSSPSSSSASYASSPGVPGRVFYFWYIST